jgi:hypothetical protein
LNCEFIQEKVVCRAPEMMVMERRNPEQQGIKRLSVTA